MQRFVISLLALCSVAAAFVPSHHAMSSISIRQVVRLQMAEEEPSEAGDSKEEEPVTATPADKADARYDVSKLVGGQGEDGGGFNQFDPVLSATGFLSRRFGILGGLAIFAGLAFVEGDEILKALDDTKGAVEGSGETITTASGLKITEVKVGSRGGTAPLPGYVIGLKAKVSIGENVIYNTAGEKPIAFKYGQRPFQNVICEGVEEGIKGMKVGGKRILVVPSNLAPPGVDLPPGVPLTFEIELTEVLSGYF
jgi:hypothetical protein